MNADGSSQTRLTFNPAQDYAPNWQPHPVPGPSEAAPDLRLYALRCNKSAGCFYAPVKDVINVIFTNTDGMEETLSHFANVLPEWTDDEGTTLFVRLGTDYGPQDAQRANACFICERYHIRFFHDGDTQKTLAAVHYDECAASFEGDFCRTPHRGTKFRESRDLIALMFRAAGYEVFEEDNVFFIVLN